MSLNQEYLVKLDKMSLYQEYRFVELDTISLNQECLVKLLKISLNQEYLVRGLHTMS